MLALAVGPKGRGGFCNTQIVSPMYNVVRAIMAAEASSGAHLHTFTHHKCVRGLMRPHKQPGPDLQGMSNGMGDAHGGLIHASLPK